MSSALVSAPAAARPRRRTIQLKNGARVVGTESALRALLTKGRGATACNAELRTHLGLRPPMPPAPRATPPAVLAVLASVAAADDARPTD